MWDQVTALAPQTEQVSPLPRVTPPVPKPVVVGVVNKEDVSHLSPLIFCKILGVLWTILGVNVDSLDPLGFRADPHGCMGVGVGSSLYRLSLFKIYQPLRSHGSRASKMC